jgi:hypothetical protein
LQKTCQNRFAVGFRHPASGFFEIPIPESRVPNPAFGFSVDGTGALW